MRIRKRNGPAASSSSSSARPEPGETATLAFQHGQRMHRLPLAAAQAQADQPPVHDGIMSGSDFQKRCSHASRGKWRKALLDMDASHVGLQVKCKKQTTDVECRWNGNIRQQGGGLWFDSKEAKSTERTVKEATSSLSEEGNSDDVSKLRGHSTSQHCADVDGKHAIPAKKQKRSSGSLDHDCHRVTAGLKTVDPDVQKVSNPKIGSNTGMNTRDGNLMQPGSQCRRMNGRGWRCSQPTLLGYALCDHHLGKAKLKSINSTNVRRGNRAVPPNEAKPLNLELLQTDGAFAPENRQQQQKKRLVKSRSLSQMNL